MDIEKNTNDIIKSEKNSEFVKVEELEKMYWQKE